MDNSSFDYDVAIVGAGWSGLSSAVALTQKGLKVVIIEASSIPGGRARKISWREHFLDNGQHLLIGGYHNVINHMNTIGVKLTDAFKRERLTLNILCDQDIHIKFPRLPAPLNSLLGFLNSTGISSKNKVAIIKLFIKLKQKKFLIDEDCILQDFLLANEQNHEIIIKFWEPIAVAALTTPIEKASTRIFLNVLKNTFVDSYSHSDFLLPRKNLGELFVEPTIHWLKENNQTILLHKRVSHIDFNTNTISIKGDTKIRVRKVIIATSAKQASNLLPNDSTRLQPIINCINNMEFEPITTVYLEFKDPINFPHHMLGTISPNIGQWYFDRALTGDPNILCSVISGGCNANNLSKDELISTIHKESISIMGHHNNTLQSAKVVKEKFAAFSCTPQINNIRPNHHTGYKDIVLAGDYIQNGLPATLEGAVINGINAASLIHHK